MTKPGRHVQNHPRGYETKSPPLLEALAGEVGVSRLPSVIYFWRDINKSWARMLATSFYSFAHWLTPLAKK